MVELPGDCNARCSKSEQAAYSRLIEDYLSHNAKLCALVLLLDCRLEPQKLDIELAGFARQHCIPLLPVLTKADKCTLRERSQQRNRWAVLLEGAPPLLCSATKPFGVVELWEALQRIAHVDA
jgi:GTP-binding protein